MCKQAGALEKGTATVEIDNNPIVERLHLYLPRKTRIRRLFEFLLVIHLIP